VDPQTQLLLAAVAYVLLGRWIVSRRAKWRIPAFSLLNLAGVFYLFFWARDPRFHLLFSLLFFVYLALVIAQFLAMRFWSQMPNWLPWLAFLVPIAFLIVIRYAPLTQLSFLPRYARDVLQRHPEFTPSWALTGYSYLAFRTSHLVLEVRNGVVPRPSFWEYTGFAFFVPTLSVGPINSYSQHVTAFSDATRPEISVQRSLLRLLIGAVKFRFLGPLLNQLTYSGLLLDGHPHLWVDLPIAAVAYYLYLYCNFSGFCDIAIGGAGLMGVPVAENFNHPFAARNPADFWNRWHITLSQYFRDVVFSPLSKMLVHAFGPKQVNHAIAVTIMVVFLLVGVWHGAGWNYAAYGAAHAIGVASNHYYTVELRKWLGKERFAAYNKSRVIHAIAVALTFAFAAGTLFLFANDWDSMKRIFSVLRAH
jgi:D-alanyl-lipoteichoic acid acyltransferase DltB (MBOAT superfamily)